jgi:hypothetical protein
LAWLFFVISLLVAARALPDRGNAFFAVQGRSFIPQDRVHNLITATWYLFATLSVCAGGLAICRIKKYKMTGGTAMNLWIVGGLSAVLAGIFLYLR